MQKILFLNDLNCMLFIRCLCSYSYIISTDELKIRMANYIESISINEDGREPNIISGSLCMN